MLDLSRRTLTASLSIRRPNSPACTRREGARIFNRSLWHKIIALDNLIDEKYDPKGPEDVLHDYFGTARLKDAVTETLVTSYELETREPWFFARHKARKDSAWDFPMAFVARATSAAPTFFAPEELKTTTPHGGLIDGAYTQQPGAVCVRRDEGSAPDNDEILVVSLGTGQHTRPIHHREAKDWGSRSWRSRP